MANKKRIATSVAAVATAAALLLGGTFAWQSVNQTALNEASDVINPGGRLHDDFNGTNKDVYVENFADEEIFARVRLEEYFEIVMNKGTPAETVEVIVGERVEQTDEDGNTVADENGKTVYDKNGAIFTDYTSEGTFGAANVKNAEGEITNSWWNWTTGGETQYLPTFNLNKDSLAADINGTYDYVDENGESDPYGDYVDYLNDYAVDDPVVGDEIYDYDANDIDEGDAAVEGTNIKTIAGESHAIAATDSATLMSMQEWINAGSNAGLYWVYDEDGWVYWAQAIQPHTATGLLLDGIALNQVMDDSWYYAINVVGQFITADDMGKTDGTGFYDETKGAAPSPEALALLKAIGVNTDGPVLVSNADELQNALANGEDVVLDGMIETTTAETHEDVRFSYDFLWHDGGTMSGGTLNMNSADSRGLFINNEVNWPENGDDANAATLSDTTVNASGVSAVYVQAIDAPVTFENVTITSDNCGLYVNMGDQPVTLNDVTINAANNDTHDGDDWFNTAVAVANPGNVIINSGTYTAENDGYAVYVFSSGGTIEINGGEFYGKLGEDAGNLIIKGGTFDHDPTAFVDTENYDVTENEDGTWTVSEKARGLYVLYLKDAEGSDYGSHHLMGTDGFVSMVYQEADSTINVEARYAGGALPEGVTIGLAAYGLAKDEWEEGSYVSAGTVFAAETNPYTFDADTGTLSDDNGFAIATINNDTNTITIDSVVDNLIVDVYLLKDGQRIESTGSSSDVEKLFNSKYFVVSAGEEA